MTDIKVNGLIFYTAEEITAAANGAAAAGLKASTKKYNYKVSYIKNVLRRIELAPLEYGYTPGFKRTIRISNKKGAPKGYSGYYVDQVINLLTSDKTNRFLLAMEKAIKKAQITRKQVENTMLKHGRYYPNSKYPQKFEFMEKKETTPDIISQEKFIDDIYKQNYRRIKNIKKTWEIYRKAVTEILNSTEISDREKIEILKSPRF